MEDLDSYSKVLLILSYLTPFFKTVVNEFAKKIGFEVWEKIKSLGIKIKNQITRKGNKSLIRAYNSFKENPKKYKNQLKSELEKQALKDNKLNELISELASLLDKQSNIFQFAYGSGIIQNYSNNHSSSKVIIK